MSATTAYCPMPTAGLSLAAVLPTSEFHEYCPTAVADPVLILGPIRLEIANLLDVLDLQQVAILLSRGLNLFLGQDIPLPGLGRDGRGQDE